MSHGPDQHTEAGKKLFRERNILKKQGGFAPPLAAQVEVDADVAAVADVATVMVMVGVEAGETLARTPTNSGRRGTRIMVPKPQSLATAVANLGSYDPNARSATPERKITALRSLWSERSLIKLMMRRP